MHCAEWTLVNHSERDAHGAVLRCKRWTCEECMPIRLHQLKTLAAEGKPQRFITLTSKFGSAPTPAIAAQQLRTALQRIVQQYNRLHPKAHIQYLAVFEETKKGWPHLHILQRGDYMSQKWLSEQMQRHTGSPVVWIERVRNATNAARYVAKYVSKGPGRFDGCKRYWSSQGWALRWKVKLDTAIADRSNWRIAGMSIGLAAQEYINRGWSVEWPTAMAFDARAGPEYHPVDWVEPRYWQVFGRAPL